MGKLSVERSSRVRKCKGFVKREVEIDESEEICESRECTRQQKMGWLAANPNDNTTAESSPVFAATAQ